MAVPLMVEILPNLSSDAFRRNVFGFSALEYVKKPFSVGFFSGINLMAAVAAFVLVWAYQKKVDKDATASWAVFFLCGSELFCVRIFHLESTVGTSDGTVPRFEYLHEREWKSASDDHEHLYAGDVYFLQPEHGR